MDVRNLVPINPGDFGRLEKFSVAGRREALLQPEKRHSNTASVKQCHEKPPFFLGMVFTYLL